MDEKQRLTTIYSKRNNAKYSYFHKNIQVSNFNKTTKISNIMKKLDLKNKLILDIGCGHGWSLNLFHSWGAQPKNLYGIDILDERINIAKNHHPLYNFNCVNAEKLSFDDNFFDIIHISTVFSSILDNNLKKKIAQEIQRILKPSGTIIWYDFFYNNPSNKNVKGIKKKEIRTLFNQCTHAFHKITLCPPIAKKLHHLPYLFLMLLEDLKILNTHYLVEMKKTNY
jgi:ubiquinone/menaquinone biosynthesis C-methylase UbiE